MQYLVLVIFGITGNLSQIKLLPALYDMEERGTLPGDMVILGNARKPLSTSEIRKFVIETLKKDNKQHQHKIKIKILNRLIKRIYYIDGHLDDQQFYPRLKSKIHSLKPNSKDIIYYLATYPNLYKDIFENLNRFKLNTQIDGQVKLIIEKPIGNDLSSAKELNTLLSKTFKENQIYRLDHYLGKETLQNILTFRFANGIFEDLMSGDYIDHIQVTASESFGVGDRGGYYDLVGALKDVGQNHLLQMIAFTTMSPPQEFNNEEVTRERIKVLKNLVPTKNLVLGQYVGYKKEKNIFQNSNTDTFFAFKTSLNISKFKSIPIYVRSGKMIQQTLTQIAIVFKNPDQRLFTDSKKRIPNVLIYRIQPEEEILITIATKKPGNEIVLEPDVLRFTYSKKGDFHNLPDPYEKLLSDAISGNQTFFNSAEEVEAQWKFIDKLVELNKQPILYKVSTWGPKEADELIKQDNRSWINK